MRTIQQIKSAIAEEWMANPSVQEAYGFDEGQAFADVFSPVSIENLLFYIVAVCTHVVEALVDKHDAEVTAAIAELVPHRPRWYALKAMAFMKDCLLIPDTDRYDTSAMSDADIDRARVVKYAVATETDDASLLTIKVAGGTDTRRQPLDADTETQLRAYLQEIKDAGVRILLINQEPDFFNASIDIYYDPQRTADDVETDCHQAIQQYLANLDFGGEYTHMAFVDALQAVPGVKIAELRNAQARTDLQSHWNTIDTRYTPEAGYFSYYPDNFEINLYPY